MSLPLALAKWSFGMRRQAFYSDLAEALADNGVLTEFLEDQRARLATRNDVEAALFALWLARLDDQSFPDALRGTVPLMDVMILGAAEASGNLTEGLKFLAMTVGAASRMKRAVLGATAMPVVMVLMLIAYVLMFALAIEPMCASLIPPEQWPFLGQILHGLAGCVRRYGVAGGAVASLAGVLIGWSMSRWAGKSRRVADKVCPLYAIYRDYTGSIFLVAMAALMQSGVGLAESLTGLHRDAPPWLQWHIDEILHGLDTQSDQPARAFATGVFSQAVTDRVEDFGKRSNFETALGKVGLHSVDRIVDQVTVSAKVLNVMLLMAISLTLVLILGGTGTIVLTAADGISSQTHAATR